MNKVNFQNRFIIDMGANIWILKEKYFKFIDFQDFKNLDLKGDKFMCL